MSTGTNTYAGWHNYETWNVNQGLTNDEGSYYLIVEMAREARNERELAQSLQFLVMDEAPQLSGIYGDLLTASLQAIDWHELASHYWVDFREEETEEELEEAE